MKKISSSAFALLLLATALPVSAARPTELSLPTKAIEVSQGVFSLGEERDLKTDSLVEGRVIVHKKSDAKPKDNNLRAPKAPATKCYAVMADGAKWKNVENWTVFPTNSGLSASFLLNNTALNMGKWETAAVANILGNGSQGVGVPSDPYVLDEKNEVSFADLEANTIAVTVVWGVWSGPVFSRRIVAWDQVFNTDYPWSSTGEANKMDYENISSHELGHSMGLSDIYTASCAEVTMYGYGALGETKKRNLETSDKTGINLLY